MWLGPDAAVAMDGVGSSFVGQWVVGYYEEDIFAWRRGAKGGNDVGL